RRPPPARGERGRRASRALDRAPGRARAADATDGAGAGRPQVHAARHLGAASRVFEPPGGELSLGTRAGSGLALSGVAIRAVLVEELGRRRPLRGRGRLPARRVTRTPGAESAGRRAGRCAWCRWSGILTFLPYGGGRYGSDPSDPSHLASVMEGPNAARKRGV